MQIALKLRQTDNRKCMINHNVEGHWYVAVEFPELRIKHSTPEKRDLRKLTATGCLLG
jgi:hypothetical protein